MNTNTHSYREKGRAMFLAAMMVLSVVAMTATLAVPAAAQQDATASVTIDDQAGTVPVDEVTVASANASEDFFIVVHEGASTPDGEVGNIIGTSGPFSSEQTDVSVTLDQDRAPLTQSQQIFAMIHRNDSGSVGAPISGSDGFVDSAQLTAAADPTNVDTIFQGEEVTIDAGAIDDVDVNSGDILQIREGILGDESSSQAAAVQVDDDLTATFSQDDTEGLNEAFHFFRIQGVNVDGTQFQGEVQDLDVSFNENVTTESTQTTLGVTSENYADAASSDDFRGSEFTLVVNSDSLNNEELTNVFGQDQADDAESGDPVTVSVENGSSVDVDFDGIDTGDYDFDVSVDETTASDDAVVAVNEPVDATAALTQDSFSENIGDVAEIGVQLSETDSATVIVETDGYTLETTVTDGDGDGEVTLEYNSANAGIGSGTVVSAAGEDDTATLVSETNIGQRVPQDSYSLQLEVNGERQERGQLVLTDRSTDAVSAHVAPTTTAGPAADADEFLAEQTPLGELGRQTIAAGDTAGVLIQVSGVEGDFEDFTGEAGLTFELVEQDPGAFGDPDVFDSSSDAIVDIVQAAEDQYLVEIDSTELPTGGYDAEFTVDAEGSPYLDDNGDDEQVTTELTIAEPDVSFIGEGDYTLTTESEVVVAGNTNLAPGTSASVNVVGDIDFIPGSTSVADDGSFAATFDLSEADPDQGGLQVEFDSELTGTVTADAEFGDTQQRDIVPGDERIPELEATISDLESQLEERDSTISDLESQLEERDSTISDLESQLEEADSTISDLESQLEERDSTISDLESQLEERNSTISDLESEVSDLESQLEDAQNDSGGDSDGGGPGFGIAAALVALIGAALLAVRRRD